MAIDIYGTLGPACESTEVLENMFAAGMSGIRLNLSHVSLKDAARQVENLHLAAKNSGVTAKLLIAERAQAAGTPIISSMGAGNKLDPTAFRVADIYETSVCPLAKVMRKECRKRGIDHLKVVYSQEPPVQECADIVGSVAFVPSVAGLTIASEVVKDLVGM